MWYWTKVLFSVLIGAVLVWLVYELVTFPDFKKLNTENPTTSSMIEYRISEAKSEGREPQKNMIWMPMEQISPNLQKAVLAGEDSHFFEHHGFDWDAINKAWEEAQKEGEKEAKEEGDYDPNDWIPPMPSFKRGASTITQQLAKNLYLSEERSFLRKGTRSDLHIFSRTKSLEKTHSRNLSECHRMGRRHLRRGSRFAFLFQKIGFELNAAGSRVSFGDDSVAAQCL